MIIRMPNTDQWITAEIDMDKFIHDRETDTEIFGWYDNQYIAIKK